MRTFYQDKSVLVTDAVFQVIGAGTHPVEIADLREVYVVRVKTPAARQRLRHVWPALRSSVTHELWGVVDDAHFCLYRTVDSRAFEQIRRAVIRAREQFHT
jgi:hypothetical protein